MIDQADRSGCHSTQENQVGPTDDWPARPTNVVQGHVPRVPGTTGRIGTAIEQAERKAGPLTNIAGARFEPTTLRIRERSEPIYQVSLVPTKPAGFFER